MASNNAPEIYVYDMSSQKLEKTIVYQREGADGVGPKVGGVLMVNWDCIYLPSLFVPEISQIDSAGHRKMSFLLFLMMKAILYYDPFSNRSSDVFD